MTDQGHNLKASLLIICAMLAFSVQDVLVKVILADISVWQMQFLRSIAALALMTLVAIAIKKGHTLLPTQWVWPFVRAVFSCGAYVFFYISLPYLSLAQASSIFFVGPMLITVLAAIFLGEPIGWRRLLAVATGFCGVLLISQPWGDGFSGVMLLPAAAAGCYSLSVIITRWRCRKDPSFSLSMMHNFFYAIVGLEGVILLELLPIDPVAASQWPALFTGWTHVTYLTAVLIISVAITHTTGALFSIRAYQTADAARIAPLEYTYLAIAPLWDMLIWQNPPTLMVLGGMTLIAAGGTLVSWREGRPAWPKPQNYGEVPWARDAHFDKSFFGTRIEIGFRVSRPKRPKHPV